MRRSALVAAVLWAAVLCAAAPAPARATDTRVDLELILAVDVSRSMDIDEQQLQRDGYVAAITHPEVVDAITQGRHGRIALSYVEWAGPDTQYTVVDWRAIDGPASARDFAAALAQAPIQRFRGTSISSGLVYVAPQFERNGFEAVRRVIDVSGDGPNNIGMPVMSARDLAMSAGIVINGLPLLIRPTPTYPHVDRYYADCVIGGPGSFMLPVYDMSEFATAIRRKLILEVSGAEPPSRVVLVADELPVDCLQGERDRRIFSDPYYPELDK